MQKFSEGDRVAIETGYVHHAQMLAERVASAPVLSVVRQMPYEPNMWELSDGRVYRGSELQLVERAPTSPDPDAA